MAKDVVKEENEKGQKVLIRDLKAILAEAEAGEYGDFTNTKYAAPKMALRNQLLSMADAVAKGKYD